MKCVIIHDVSCILLQATKQSAGGRATAGSGGGGSGGGMDVSLELQEGCELLVEEQGAASKLIRVDAASLADMEVSEKFKMES